MNMLLAFDIGLIGQAAHGIAFGSVRMRGPSALLIRPVFVNTVYCFRFNDE